MIRDNEEIEVGLLKRHKISGRYVFKGDWRFLDSSERSQKSTLTHAAHRYVVLQYFSVSFQIGVLAVSNKITNKNLWSTNLAFRSMLYPLSLLLIWNNVICFLIPR